MLAGRQRMVSPSPQGRESSLTLRVEVPCKVIAMKTVKKFPKSITVRDAVELCKKGVAPCLSPLPFHLFSAEGQRYDDSGTLSNYGLCDMETVLLKPESEADVEKCLAQEEEDKIKPPPVKASEIVGAYTKGGFLLKRKMNSSVLGGRAKRCWCVLKDNYLYVFANPRDREPDCSFDLERCLINFAEDWEARSRDGRGELFNLTSKNRAYTFLVESETDARSWYEAMMKRQSSDENEFLARLRKSSVTGYVIRRARGLASGQRRWAMLVGSTMFYHESPADHEATLAIELMSTKTVLFSDRAEVQITQIGEEPFTLSFESAESYTEWAKHMKEAAPMCVTDSTEIENGIEDVSAGFIKAGYMMKKKLSRRFSSTKKRWFVLKANRLYYMHSHLDTISLGFFDLLHTQVNFYLLDEEQTRGEAALELITIGGVYVLKHPENSDQELREWCEAIRVQCVGVPFNVVHKQHVDLEFNWSGENAQELFESQEKMGEGAYATVHRAKHKESGLELAIKILHSEDAVMTQALQQEIDVLKRCRSPQVVCYYGTIKIASQLWILTELCACGSVKDIMKTTLETLSEPQLAYVVSETLKGLAYLHSMNIIHHDIKAGNILLTDEAQVKLADFGVSQQYKDMHDIRADDFIGSPLYMSPEIIRKCRYNNKADIWSLGITVIEMAEGAPPNTQVANFEELLKITEQAPPTLQHPKHWSTALNDFIARCLTSDMDLRPDTIDLLLDPFTRTSTGKETMMPLVTQCMATRQRQRERKASDKQPLQRRPALRDLNSGGQQQQGQRP
eukprot:m51a1_g12279 putative protein kinase domain containing protein (793) ;mRNA; f:233982-237061